MQKSDLTCLFFPDLLPWERTSLEPLLAYLGNTYKVEQWDVTQLGREKLKEARRGDNIWVVANRWQQALRFLTIPTKARIFVSVLGTVSSPDTLATLIWRRFRPLVSPSVKLIAHSPLSYRFLKEIQHVPEHQVCFLPLPVHIEPPTDSIRKSEPSEAITVGTLARFSSESNLNYFLTVAHYVIKQNPRYKFRILGAGLLAPHIKELVNGMELSENISVEICRDGFDVSGFDIFLYTPLQNEHFIPVAVAAVNHLPIVANEVPGIEQMIVDGRDGFLVGVNEVRSMGELVLRLGEDSYLRNSIARKLSERIRFDFSPEAIASQYETLFFEKIPKSAVTKAA